MRRVGRCCAAGGGGAIMGKSGRESKPRQELQRRTGRGEGRGMLRALVLLLVIVGAFAAVFAVVPGVGVVRIPAQGPAAGPGPLPQPVVTPAVAAPAAPPAMAVLAPPAIAPAPLSPVAAGTIVLTADDAKLSGPRIRLYTSKEEDDGGGLRDERGMGRQRVRFRRSEGRRDEGALPPVIEAWSQPQD